MGAMLHVMHVDIIYVTNYNDTCQRLSLCSCINILIGLSTRQVTHVLAFDLQAFPHPLHAPVTSP